MKRILLIAGLHVAIFSIAETTYAQGSRGFFIEPSIGVALGYTNSSSVDDNVGFAVDVVAGKRFKSPRIVVGGAVGKDMTGPGDDVCRIGPDGGCAVFPNFVSAALLVGVENAQGTVRVWAGPSHNRSDSDGSSVGVQARADVSKWLTTHIGIGAGLRLNAIPNYKDDSYQLLALSAAVRIQQ